MAAPIQVTRVRRRDDATMGSRGKVRVSTGEEDDPLLCSGELSDFGGFICREMSQSTKKHFFTRAECVTNEITLDA